MVPMPLEVKYHTQTPQYSVWKDNYLNHSYVSPIMECLEYLTKKLNVRVMMIKLNGKHLDRTSTQSLYAPTTTTVY